MSEDYNADYFERGVANGVSGYSNYRWMPELTIPMAHQIVQHLGLRQGEKVLDYGCAKGFLVRALRLLRIDAYGCDISQYALSQGGVTKEYLSDGIPDCTFQAIIAKDVFEHMGEQELDNLLYYFADVTQKIFVVVPLGEDGRYVVPSYERDTTHVIRKPLGWWSQKLVDAGFNVVSTYECGFLKENYQHYPRGNGFLTGTANG